MCCVGAGGGDVWDVVGDMLLCTIVHTRGDFRLRARIVATQCGGREGADIVWCLVWSCPPSLCAAMSVCAPVGRLFVCLWFANPYKIWTLALFGIGVYCCIFLLHGLRKCLPISFSKRSFGMVVLVCRYFVFTYYVVRVCVCPYVRDLSTRRCSAVLLFRIRLAFVCL